MILKFWMPGPPLGHFIENVAYHSGYRPAHTKELLLPDGGVNLVFELSDEAKYVFNRDSLEPERAYRSGWISGMHENGLVIDAGRGTPMLVVRFKPGGLWPFFGFPSAELNDVVLPLTDIWGRPFRDLHEQLLEAPTATARFAVLERELIRIGGARLNPDPFVGYAARTLWYQNKPPSMKALASKLGYSQKHMIAIFDKHVGLSPKRYARVMRFQRVIHALERDETPSWSMLAQEFGYYDQAHLINDFKAFAGMTPTHYLRSKGPFLNFLPIG